MRTERHKQLEGHLILCGMGHVGYRIVELLHELCEPFAIITGDIRPEWRATVESAAALFVEGDARSERCLLKAGIKTARAIFIVTSDDLVNVEIALDAQRLNPNITLIVRVFDRYLADRTKREAGVRNVLSPALLTAPVFVAAALGDEMLRAFDIGGSPLNIVRLTLAAGKPEVGEALHDFCAHYDITPLALHRNDLPAASSRASSPCEERTASGTVHERDRSHAEVVRLEAGDSLVVAASGAATERLRQSGHLAASTRLQIEQQSFGTRIRALLTRPFYPMHVLRRIWKRTPRALRFAFLTLHVLILISVVIFHAYLPGTPSWVDSFYFVVTMMTTVGFEDFHLHQAEWWLKLYGCGVMISGAALVAILFGIITDYIVSLRVDQALGKRASQLTDHIVVIGLGDVGTRVTEELQRIGEPVVAIERDTDHEASPTLQDRIHVIVGDANRDSTLIQANIPQARAVIVTATKDFDSLRIAHQAEMLNPKLRSVIRIYDSALAHKLGVGLGIDSAVNAAATAAATFIACAFAKNVEQAFQLDKRLLLLRWLEPEELETAGLLGLTIREVQAKGTLPMLRRAQRGVPIQTLPVKGTDVISPGDSLLILEEYLPDTKRCVAPSARVSFRPIVS